MIDFDCNDAAFLGAFRNALNHLKSNCGVPCPEAGEIVLNEGGSYPGIWLECGPFESTFYAPIEPEIALASHRIFYRLQKADGQFPAFCRTDGPGFSQIQQVVPIAATAYELGFMLGDEKFLAESYEACRRWEEWLSRHRDHDRLGLCEVFCCYDTGHDNSPRFAGIPDECSEKDAAQCPDAPGMPRLAPDLSANRFGARKALVALAQILGKPDEASRWEAAAEQTRKAILRYCYDPESEFFYDRDCRGNLIKIKGDAGLRVLGEHVVSQEMFDRIFERHLSNRKSFNTPYPFPSIAADEPVFVHPPVWNSWGGPSQALCALRSTRYLEYYGHPEFQAHLMKRWLEALVRSGKFCQQLDPFTGESSTTEFYTPALCCMIDFTARLSGVVQMPDSLRWGCAPPGSSTRWHYAVDLYGGGRAETVSSESGVELRLNGRVIHTAGPNTGSIVTTRDGRLLAPGPFYKNGVNLNDILQ